MIDTPGTAWCRACMHGLSPVEHLSSPMIRIPRNAHALRRYVWSGPLASDCALALTVKPGLVIQQAAVDFRSRTMGQNPCVPAIADGPADQQFHSLVPWHTCTATSVLPGVETTVGNIQIQTHGEDRCPSLSGAVFSGSLVPCIGACLGFRMLRRTPKHNRQAAAFGPPCAPACLTLCWLR
jgi:hypothetical protein